MIPNKIDSNHDELKEEISDLRSDLNKHSLLAMDKYATKEVTDRHAILLQELPRIGNLELRVATLEKLNYKD